MSEASTLSRPLHDKRVVLGVTGSIAAYKAAELARLLVKAGARVDVVLTSAAQQFVGKALFGGITGRAVVDDMWSGVGEPHVELARADLVVVAPATADFIARASLGRADDLLAATLLCTRAPVLLAPAMHPNMWSHPATQRNVARLLENGASTLVGPEHGEVASGEEGVGRLSDPTRIFDVVLRRLAVRDLEGQRIVVTAGPTIEDLDPVRFLGNRSSGKMGFALAERAAVRGATVTLVAGPVDLPTPLGVTRVDVRTAVAMRGAVWQALGPNLDHADALLMAAAVADYRFAEQFAGKKKRDAAEERVHVELVMNPDILSEVGKSRTQRRPVLVGFCVETESEDRLIALALEKLRKKRVDLVVANRAEDSFGRADNTVTLVTSQGAAALGTLPKMAVADRILDWLYQRLWDTSSGAT